MEVGYLKTFYKKGGGEGWEVGKKGGKRCGGEAMPAEAA